MASESISLFAANEQTADVLSAVVAAQASGAEFSSRERPDTDGDPITVYGFFIREGRTPYEVACAVAEIVKVFPSTEPETCEQPNGLWIEVDVYNTIRG